MVVVVLGLAGCVRLLGHDDVTQIDGASGPPDLAHDRAPTDQPAAPGDGLTSDGPLPTPDGPLPDAPQSDGPQIYLDGPLPKPDSWTPSVNCATGTVATQVAVKTSLCVSQTLSYNQCSAENLCAKGHAKLCTAVQYQNRVKSGIATTAWIGSCVRQGGSPTAPTNNGCSTCSSFVLASAVVEWPCSTGGIGVGSTESHLGLVTHTSCLRVGLDQGSTEGYWQPSPASGTLSAAICCK